MVASPSDSTAHPSGVAVTTGAVGVDAITGALQPRVRPRCGHQVYCWGFSRYGETGSPGSEFCASTSARDCVGPMLVSSVAATQVSADANFTVAIETDGTVTAWGLNASGQLGHSPAPDPTCVDAPCAPPGAVVFAQ